MEADVIIVGAGVAGLAAAVHLEGAGLSCLILERGDEVGGRIRTDVVEGFKLDRGFQVYLTAYPEGRAMLDYSALKLGEFVPGALSWNGGGFDRISDPRRDRVLSHWWANVRSGAMTWWDAVRAGRMIWPTLRGHAAGLLVEGPEGSISDELAGRGFSGRAMDRFWRPFLGGVFLERELETSARFARFTLRMFATGETVLPAEGMQAIPRQLAGRLTRSTIELNASVASITEQGVRMADGSERRCANTSRRAVIVATEHRAAKLLLGEPAPAASGRGTVCLYFATAKAPVSEAILMLDGTGRGPINTVVVPTLTQPAYGPGGEHLVSLSTVGVTGLDDDALRAAALEQMRGWFGGQVDGWRHLRTYRIPEALPGSSYGRERAATGWPGVYWAGDAVGGPSIQGAMASARRAADAVVGAMRAG